MWKCSRISSKFLGVAAAACTLFGANLAYSAPSQCGPVINNAKLLFTFECFNDSVIQVTDSSQLGWKYTVDSINDGVNYSQIGTIFEAYGMATLETPTQVYVVLNSNVPLEGNPNSGAAGGSVSHGDLLIDLSGGTFEDASNQRGLYGVRYSPYNESGVPDLGVYKSVVAKSITSTNSGFSSLTQHINWVTNLGGTPSLGDLPIDQTYYNPAMTKNVMQSGIFLGGIEYVDSAELATLGFNNTIFLGSHTIAFKFDKTLIVDQCGVLGGDGSSCADCAGVTCGTAVLDQCGVCGGDNASCLDCAGVPNGAALIDSCGVCGGDNSTCMDCRGVPNGSATVDACGVCGGDGSSCAGCDGVPNSGQVLDMCGVCGGDNSSCKDCSGVPNGSAEIDACGVCGGASNTCLDCKGVPNGSAQVDACGVCGGNITDPLKCAQIEQCPGGVLDQCGVCNGSNDCLDCAGIPNGGTKLDCCGVCGGDGSSCPELCKFYDLTQIKRKSKRALRDLFGSVRKYSAREAQCGAGAKAKQNARKRIQVAREVFKNNITALQEQVKDQIKVCDTQWCAKESSTATLEAIRSNTKQLYRLSRISQRRAAALCGGGATTKGAAKASPSRRNFGALNDAMKQVPDAFCKN